MLLVKTAGIAVRGQGQGANRAAHVANLLLFVSLLSAHLLTNVYYHAGVNRAYSSIYLCLVLGAGCRLAHAERLYWALLLPAVACGWGLQVLLEQVAVLQYWRFAINSFLVHRLALLVSQSAATADHQTTRPPDTSSSRRRLLLPVLPVLVVSYNMLW